MLPYLVACHHILNCHHEWLSTEQQRWILHTPLANFLIASCFPLILYQYCILFNWCKVQTPLVQHKMYIRNVWLSWLSILITLKNAMNRDNYKVTVNTEMEYTLEANFLSVIFKYIRFPSHFSPLLHTDHILLVQSTKMINTT